MDGTKRKRSRWGTKQSPDHPTEDNTATTSNALSHESVSLPPDLITNARVSDDAAMAALLASAQSNEERRRKDQMKSLQRSNHSFKSSSETKDQRTNDRQVNLHYGPDRDSSDRGEQEPKRQRRKWDRDQDKNDSKYSWGGSRNPKGQSEEDEETNAKREKQKANFGLSGALATDNVTGNVFNGVLLKFTEPPEARAPNTRWRLYVFKQAKNDNSRPGGDGELLEIMHISKQSAYLFGRERKVADVPVDHPSLSKQHCVLQYRALPDRNDREHRIRCKPYLMDLGSTNGTFINGLRLEDARYYELRKGDVITLGASTREYVLLTENSTSA